MVFEEEEFPAELIVIFFTIWDALWYDERLKVKIWWLLWLILSWLFLCVCVIVAIVGQKGLLRKSLTTCPQFSCFTAFLLLCIISCVNFLIRFCWVSQFLVGNASKKNLASIGGFPRRPRWETATKVGRFSFDDFAVRWREAKTSLRPISRSDFLVEPVANVYPVMLPMSFKDLEATPFSYQGLLCFTLNPKGFNHQGVGIKWVFEVVVSSFEVQILWCPFYSFK